MGLLKIQATCESNDLFRWLFMTAWSSYLSDGPWRRCVGPWMFHMALVVLAGTGAAVLTEAPCFSYIHPAVLTQSLATVWQLRQSGPWVGHYHMSVQRGNTHITRAIVCYWIVVFLYLCCRENLYSRQASFMSHIYSKQTLYNISIWCHHILVLFLDFWVSFPQIFAQFLYKIL